MLGRLLCIALLVGSANLRADGFIINQGIGGTWYNRDQDGQGFLIDVMPGSPPLVVLAWYTYDELDGSQAWMFGTGPIEGQDSAVIELLQPIGGVFDDPAEVDKVPWGTAEVSFRSCRRGKIVYDSPANGLSGAIDIHRLTSDSLCRQFDVNGSQLYSGGGDYAIQSDGAAIATNLRLPAGDGPHPVVVLIHGSGTAATRTNLKWIGDLLLPRGFAAMTYDKRGVGASEGVFVEAGPFNNRLHELAGDILAMVGFLRHHQDIRHDQIGLLGISQGGWINAIVGGNSAHVAFMVSVVGPVMTVGEEIHYSNFTEQGSTILEANAAVRNFTGFHGYDPVPDLQVVGFPALWVLGGLDRSISTDITIERLEELIAAGAPFEFQLHPQGNHGLRTPQGSPIPFLTPPGGAFEWIESVLGPE